MIFGNANIGNIQLTNLDVPGQLASDQTFAVLALRCFLYFEGQDRRTLYLGVSTQLFWTLVLGDKPQFQCPAWYLPAGGGIWGFDSGTGTGTQGAGSSGSIFANGVPSQESILKLAKPLLIPVRQAIKVRADFFLFGTHDILNGASPSINSPGTTQHTQITYMVDGLQTRDVE